MIICMNQTNALTGIIWSRSNVLQCILNQQGNKMNSRKFSRTMDEAFPFGPKYGCAIEKPRRSEIVADYALAIGIALALAVGMVKYFS